MSQLAHHLNRSRISVGGIMGSQDKRVLKEVRGMIGPWAGGEGLGVQLVAHHHRRGDQQPWGGGGPRKWGGGGTEMMGGVRTMTILNDLLVAAGGGCGGRKK